MWYVAHQTEPSERGLTLILLLLLSEFTWVLCSLSTIVVIVYRRVESLALR